MSVAPGEHNLASPDGSVTVHALGMVVQATVMVLIAIGLAGLTRPTDIGWTWLIVGTLAGWAVWLVWRTAWGDHTIPFNLLLAFLGAPVVIILAHLVGGGRMDPRTHRFSLLADGDTGPVAELMTLGLLMLVAQDVLSRIRNPRWPVTLVGVAAMLGAILGLSGKPNPGQFVLSLVGYAGVGMVLTPCLLPHWAPAHATRGQVRRWALADNIVRATVAAAVVAVLLLESPAARAAGEWALGAAGVGLVLAGVLLRQARWVMLTGGAIMLVAAGVMIAQDPIDWPAWSRTITAFGGLAKRSSGAAGGAEMLAVWSGWVGLGALTLGFLAVLCGRLWRAREFASGDQFRAALWSAVALITVLAVLSPGGLAVPCAALAMAAAWGLMPHIMAQPVRRLGGLVAAGAFAAALAVLGLEQQLSESRWLGPLLTEGDSIMHFFSALMLTTILFWAMRSRKAWQAVLWTLAGGTLASLGEVAQHYLSTRAAEWKDVLSDYIGAAMALMVYLIVGGFARLERRLRTRRAAWSGYHGGP